MAEDPTAVVRIEEDTPRETSADELIELSDLSPDDVAAAEECARQAIAGRPHVTLTGYQKLIVTATRRFIAMMVCRQGGKTFASTLRIARKLFETVMNYYILSRSERQSGNAIAQLAAHVRAVVKALLAKGKRLDAGQVKGTRYRSQRLRYHRADGSAVVYTRLTVQLPNGAQAIGLPASPDTVVGISGAMYGDEFALHKDSRDIYGRIFPIVSRRREYEMLLTSTPRGLGNKFHDIMTGEDYDEIFLRVIVDIFTAVQQGLRLYDYEGNPVEDDEGIDKLRRALKDDDKWAEEYLCQFVADVLQLLTHDLISNCEALHDPDGNPYEILDYEVEQGFDPTRINLAKQVELWPKGDIFLGFDQARQKDLSVIWLDQEHQGELWCKGLVRMPKIDYETQEQILWQFMDLPLLAKAGIDSTGLGSRTAERAVIRYGEAAIPVNFSSNIQDRQGSTHRAKALIARTIRERHQDGRDHYPILDIIRSDFTRVKRKAGASPDSFTYFADHDATGHADIFTAKGLSDLVAQELREFGGRIDGIRLSPPVTSMEEELQSALDRKRLRPDHSSDWRKDRGEYHGIGAGIC